MNQAELLKLAEVAGKIVHFEYHKCYLEGDDGLCDEFWYPHKDLNQAFECLENCDYCYKIEKLPRSPYELYCIELHEEMVIQGPLPEAICKAVLEASK